MVCLWSRNLEHLTLATKDYAQSLSHEVGHALRGGSHSEGIGNPLPRYHLMAKDGVGNPTRDDSPDSSGKHWYVRETEKIKVAPAEPVLP